MKIMRPKPKRVKPLEPGASLDQEHEKIQEIIKVTGVPLQSGERIDPYAPPDTLHKACVTHGCTLCENFCEDHGCRVCMTQPCGGPKCQKCFEAFGTTSVEKWEKIKGTGEGFSDPLMIQRNYLSPDVAFWLDGARSYIKNTDMPYVRQGAPDRFKMKKSVDGKSRKVRVQKMREDIGKSKVPALGQILA